jgi:hypothetical protein
MGNRLLQLYNDNPSSMPAGKSKSRVSLTNPRRYLRARQQGDAQGRSRDTVLDDSHRVRID